MIGPEDVCVLSDVTVDVESDGEQLVKCGRLILFAISIIACDVLLAVDEDMIYLVGIVSIITRRNT